MKITDYLNTGKKFFSVEVSPPTKNKQMTGLFKIIERFLPYNPAYISITYHPLKITHINVNNDSTQLNNSLYSLTQKLNPTSSLYNITSDYYQKKHANPLGVCAAIKYKYGVEVMPHFVCAGMNKVQVEEALLDFAFLGIKNVFALRGDPFQANEKFKPIDGGYRYANELVSQITDMKNSLFMNKVDGYESIDFCVGVAAYPEKHSDATDIDDDIRNLKRKVDAGADFIITQMCLDADVFLQWQKKIRDAGITVPIIPGLKPLTSVSQLLTLKYTYHVNIPEHLEKLFESVSDKEKAYKIGVEHCIELSKKLLDAGASGIHYFTMGTAKDIEEVVKELF